MSLFSSPIDDEIKETLNFRQGEPSPPLVATDRISWDYEKTCWAMLVSNNALADKNATGGWDRVTRTKEALYLGSTTFNQLGKPTSVKTHRGESSTNVESNHGTKTVKYQNRPTPGISSVSISPKDSKNTIVEATINFQVWTLEDLGLYEKLYMTPGTTLRLEWGWSVKPPKASIKPEPLPSNKIYDPVDYYNKALERKKKTGGHWDGIMGKVVNFEWQLNDNGGFDCMTKIVTIGDMLLSTSLDRASGFKANSSKKDSDSPEATPLTNVKAAFATAKRNIISEQQWLQGNFTETAQMLSQLKVSGIGVPSEDDSDTAGDEAYVADSAWYSDGHYQYVYWGWVEDYLITGNLGFNSTNRSYPSDYKLEDSLYPPSAVVKHKNIWPKLYSGRITMGGITDPAMTCRNNMHLKSCDPYVCALPGFTLTNSERFIREYDRSNSWIGYFFVDAPATPPSNLNQAVTTSNVLVGKTMPSFSTSDEYATGYIRNILVNVRWLEGVMDKNKTVDTFLKEALDGISEACGGLWEFEVVGHERFPELLRVVESGHVDKGTAKAFLLKVFNVNSAVRKVTMTSKVSERMKGSIMAGQVRANQDNKSNDVTTDNESEAQSFFGAPVKDLTDYNSYAVDPKDIGSSTNSEDVDGVKDFSDITSEAAQAFQDLANARSQETVDRCKAALKEIFRYSTPTGQDVENKYLTQSLVIPFSLNIEIDGISGLKFGNKITIDYKPDRYLTVKDENGDQKSRIYFQAKKVEHNISPSGWTTNIETHPIINAHETT